MWISHFNISQTLFSTLILLAVNFVVLAKLINKVYLKYTSFRFSPTSITLKKK